MTINRKDYLAKKVSHEDYYAQFVTPEIIRTVSITIGGDKIKRSTDPRFFNDIPLHDWDCMHNYIAQLTKRARKDAKETLSLSFTVCVAKAAARQIRESE